MILHEQYVYLALLDLALAMLGLKVNCNITIHVTINYSMFYYLIIDHFYATAYL